MFGTDHTVSEISDLEKVENKLERGDGQLIEVYTGTQDASGAPILLEIYLSTAALPTGDAHAGSARSSRCRSSR